MPEEFHKERGLLPIFMLVCENWVAMGSDAGLVILSVGLALRDIARVHFHEDDEEYADIVSDHIKGSPLHMNDAHRLSEIWSQQLPVQDHSSDEGQEHVNSKGKAKAKAGRKRKATSSKEDSHTAERHPS